MKNKLCRGIAFSILSVGMLFTSCQKDECPKTFETGDSAITLSSNIISTPVRVEGNNWDANDKIGVFMLKQGKTLATATAGEIFYRDVTYVASAQGNKVRFNPESDADKMFFPQDGSQVDFVGYYPKSLTYDNNSYQTELDLLANNIDILYSNNLVGKDKTAVEGSLVLGFRHALSGLKVTLKDKDANNITTATVQANNLYHKGTFSLVDGSTTNANTQGDYSLVLLNDFYQTTIIPQQWQENTMQLVISYNGKRYTWNAPAANVPAGRRITYELTLLPEGLVETGISGQIEDWQDIDGGTHQLGPDNNPSNITLELAESMEDIEATAHNGQIRLNTNASNFTAQVTEGSDWLTATADLANKTIRYTATENTTNSKRVGKILVSATANASSQSSLRNSNTTTLEIVVTQKAREATTDTEFDGGISALKQLPVDQVISGQEKVRGVVISGYRNFNSNKNIVVSDDKAGILLRIADGNSTQFPEGTEVEIDPNGFTLSRYNDGPLQIQDITMDKIKTVEQKHTIMPVEVTYADLISERIKEELDNRLIKLSGVQTLYTTFKDNRTPYTFHDAQSKHTTTKHAITDNSGVKPSKGYYHPALFASKFSPWANNEMPTGNGYIIAVVQRDWNSKYKNFSAKLWIRDWDTDLKLDGPRN